MSGQPDSGDHTVTVITDAERLFRWKRRVDAICDEFERQWHGDGSSRVGPGHLDEAGADQARRAALLAELLKVERDLRKARGDEPSATEILGRFPDPGDAEAVRAAFRDRFIGPYEVLGTIGGGGFGDVFDARHPDRPGQSLALKRLKIDNSAVVGRFLRVEVPVARSLDHEHVVATLDAGRDHQGRPYYVMPKVAGRDLAKLLEQEGPLEPRRAARLLAQAAQGLDYAHTRGVLHRDIKPRNLLVTPDDRLYVVDFGLAKVVGADDPDSNTRDMMGTFEYMSPEQVADSKRVGMGTDVYSLGVTLFECACGRVPFPHDRAVDPQGASLLRKIPLAPPPRPRAVRPGLPADLETVILACLEKRPEDRYLTAKALAEDLERLADGKRILRRPPGAATRMVRWARARPSAAGALVLFVLATAAGLFGLQQWRHGVAQADAAARLRSADARSRQAIDEFAAFAGRLGATPDQIAPIVRGLIGPGADSAEDRRFAAFARSRLGRILDLGGRKREAVDEHRAALALRQAEADDRPGDPDRLAELAESYHDLAVLARDLGDLESADLGHAEALQLRRRVVKQRPGDLAALVDLGEKRKKKSNGEGKKTFII